MTDMYTAADVRMLIQVAATLNPDNFDMEEARAVIYKTKATMRKAARPGGVDIEVVPYREDAR